MAALGLVLGGCTASIGAAPTSVDHPAAKGEAPAPSATGEPAHAPAPFKPAPAALRRLTVPQYQNSLRDLLGAGVSAPAALPIDPNDPEALVFTNVSASTIVTSPAGVEQYENAALGAAAQVFGEPTRRQTLVGCAPMAATDACVSTYLRRMLRRTWRRPPTDAEVARYAALTTKVATDAGNVWRGLEQATATMLQSPRFLYRAELGQPDPARPGLRRYDGFDLASRLSYFLWDTLPDDALLDAAERGELDTDVGLRRQAERLLASPRLRPAVLRFFTELLALDAVGRLAKSKQAFPQFTSTLAAGMRAELERLVTDASLDRDLDLRTLFTTRETFVNGELAQLYGMTDVTGTELRRVTLPEDGPRAGLITLAGILAANARDTETSPTLRGLFVVDRLLCAPVAPPPPGVEANLPAPTGRETTRARLARHNSNPACAGCHRQMDPVGLALEEFDGLGAFRREEQGQPIDVRAELYGETFAGGRALGVLLAGRPQTAACLAQQMYRFATGRAEDPGEEHIVADLSRRFAAGGYRARALIHAVVESDAFRFAGEQP